MDGPEGRARAARLHTLRWLLQQVALVAAGVVVYFGVRGLTVGGEVPAVENAQRLLGLEDRLGIDVEHRAQSVVVGSRVLVDLANWVYIWGHWPVIVAAMVWLGIRHRAQYLRLRDAMFVSGLMGMVVFATHPVAPPRLAGRGYVDTVTEHSHSYRVLQPPAFVNPYAALPSLHVGWDLLVGIVLVSAAGAGLLRLVGVLMPVLMTVAVVVTGNHYVLDALAGAGFALVGLVVADLLAARRAARATAVAGSAAPAAAANVSLPAPRSSAHDGLPASREDAASACSQGPAAC